MSTIVNPVLSEALETRANLTALLDMLDRAIENAEAGRVLAENLVRRAEWNGEVAHDLREASHRLGEFQEHGLGPLREARTASLRLYDSASDAMRDPGRG